MPATVAALDHVALRYRTSLVLRDVSLRLEPGEAVGLFGANGSGKTTLLRLLATLERPSHGSGTVLGAALAGPEVDAVRPRIGLIGHEPSLSPRLTLNENLAFVAEILGRDLAEASSALAAVGLEDAADRRASQCSNGMRRRAEFARILLSGPELLLLDEAHVGLDPEATRLVEHMVADVTGRGGAVVLVSHERDKAERMVDRIVHLRDGRLEASP